MQQLPPSTHRALELRHVLLTAALGILVGLVGSLFHLSIDWLLQWPRWLEQVIDGPLLIVTAALVTMTCTVLAVFLVRRFAPEAGGSGVQEIEGAMEGLREVRWRRVLPVKFVAGLTAISSGLVLGREGPTIHIGASIAAGVAEFARTADIDRRGMLAAGAAAGLACAFNAPLAAVLFVIEETHKEFPYTFRTYMGVIVASVFCTIVTEMIGGIGPDLTLVVDAVPLHLLPAFLLLGCAAGALGVALNASILWTTDAASRFHPRAPYLYPALVGLATGALLIVLPQTVTGGETVITRLGAQHLGIAALLGLAVLRMVTMVTSYSTGAPGGIFAPILALAISVGLAFGTIVERMLPDAGVVPLAFGIVAMGALFTSSVRAPVVGVALTLELTGSYTLALPLLLTCVTANLVAHWLGGRPIYAQLLDRTLAQAQIARAPHKADPVELG